MRVEGKKNDYIARELGVTHRTLHVWFSQEIFKAEIRRLLDHVDEVFAEKLAGAGLRAISELSEFAATNAVRVQAHCQTCGWFGMTPANHGSTDAPCTGPWEIREFIGESTKIEAITELLDRLPQTARIRDIPAPALPPGGAGDTNYMAIFANMDDKALAEYVRNWQSAANGHDAQPVIEG